VAEQITIELVVDDSQLQPAIDLLEKTGQIDSKLANGFRQTTAEINKQAAAIKTDTAAVAALQKNFDQLSKELKEQNQFLIGFKEGVEDALKEAGVTLEQFFEALKNGPPEAGKATDGLRTRLKELTAQIAQLKLAGEDNTDQFRELVVEAGRIKDAMGDAGAEIRNLASDTGTFDGLISAAQGVTGAFQIGQGVTALFGEESEELQKTLLRVNAVMAIAQGLQQVQNVLQKESAASRLLDTIAAKAQIAIQRLYTAVTGQATAATVAFKVALATTGVGLLVIGILALVQALNEQDDALEDVNSELEKNKALIEADIKSLERRTDIAVAEAQKAGKAESDITKLRGRSLLQQRQLLVQSNQDLARLRDQLDSTSEGWSKYNDQIEANREAIEDIDTKLVIDNLNFQKQLTDEAKKAAEEAKKAAEERAAKAREARLRELNDQLALLERQLLNAEEGGEEELRIKQKIVAAKSRIELEGENLTKNQKLLIQEKSIKEQIDLERDRNKKLTAEALAGQISLNNTVLSQIKTSDDDRLLLQISNIELAAQLEIDAAEKNSNKIKEIIAKRDADIAALKKNFIDQQAEQEIALLTASEGVNNRAQQRIAADEKKSVLERIKALQQLAQFDIGILERREKALEDQLAKGLISEQEYNLRYAILQDEKAKIAEETEKKITGIHVGESEKRKKIDQETIELALNVAGQVSDILQQLSDQQLERDQQRADSERAKVQELLEAGAITEKEAIARNKRIDNEEKKIRREAAQRDKALAIFDSLIATAQAVVRALAVPPAPNVVLAAIAGALGAAQTAIIAARPIPKFKGGKKNRYEGPGIIGEDGAEIFEHNGNRYIAHKETLVWLGKDDKVYTPMESKRMLPGVDRKTMAYQPEQKEIDQERFAETVAGAVAAAVKEMPQTILTVDNDGFNVGIQEGLSRKNYMDKYYSSK
jgi:hypothetical protein